MRAAQIVGYGEPPHLVELASPTRPARHCLIATRAVPITPLDVLCATGQSYFGAPVLPYVPGVQGVGVVVESDTIEPGSRVWFPTCAGMAPGDGSLGERAVALDTEVIALPHGVPDQLVAALGLSAVASWMSVAVRGALQAGEVVLVLGAGGVVGQVAIQLARLLGAGRVIAAARSEDACELARQYGADAVVQLRSGEDAASLAARLEHACEAPVDLVVDPLCGVPASAAIRVLGNGGRVVNLGGSAGPTAEFDSATLRSRSAAILGYTNNSLSSVQRRDAMTRVLDHAVRDGLTVSHEVVDWADAPSAWAQQARGAARRRLVVTVG